MRTGKESAGWENGRPAHSKRCARPVASTKNFALAEAAPLPKGRRFRMASVAALASCQGDLYWCRENRAERGQGAFLAPDARLGSTKTPFNGNAGLFNGNKRVMAGAER